MTAYNPCTYRVSAKAVITNQKGLLLVKEDSEYWDLPGGGVEHFEKPEDTLKREVKEEVGVQVLTIDKTMLRAWATYDHEDERPLLFLVYPIDTNMDATLSPDKNIIMDYFTDKDIETLSIEPHLKDYRNDLIRFALSKKAKK